jgi:hypothetical protein
MYCIVLLKKEMRHRLCRRAVKTRRRLEHRNRRDFKIREIALLVGRRMGKKQIARKQALYSNNNQLGTHRNS